MGNIRVKIFYNVIWISALDGRRTTDAQRTKTDHNSSPRAFGSGELNIVSVLSL